MYDLLQTLDDDVDLLYPLSSDFNGKQRYVTYRPRTEDFSPEWGKEKVDELKHYLMLDPLTSQGRSSIAKYHGFSDEWEACVKDHDDNTSIATKLFQLGRLYAKNGSKNKVYLSWTEGQHRLGAMVQALTGSKIRETDGVIKEPNRLTIDDFSNYRLIPEKKLPPDFDFNSCVQEALASSDNSSGDFPMLHEVCAIEVRWISTTEESVSHILSLARQLSQAISESKTTSVRKNAFNELGCLAKQYVLDLHKDARHRRPDTSGTLVQLVPGKKAQAVKRDYQDAGGDLTVTTTDKEMEKKTFPSFDYLYSDEYEIYAQDPFNDDHSSSIYDTFTYNQLRSKKSTKPMSPPYTNTHPSIAVDPYRDFEGTKSTLLSTWHINSLILFPLVYHHLHAEVNNTTISLTTKNDEVKRRILYAMRYHMASRSMEAMATHGALEVLYSRKQEGQTLVDARNNITAASFFIVDSINAVLSFVTESHTDVHEFVTNKERAANLIGTVYSTLPIKDGSVPVQDIIQALGKDSTTPFITNIHISLTLKLFLQSVKIYCYSVLACSSMSVDV